MSCYNLNDVCADKVAFSIEEGRLKNIVFHGGCPGNLKAIALLLEGRPAAEAVKLEGLRCADKDTSCPDQLAKAVKAVLSAAD